MTAVVSSYASRGDESWPGRPSPRGHRKGSGVVTETASGHVVAALGMSLDDLFELNSPRSLNTFDLVG